MADRITTAPLAVQAIRARREWRASSMYATLKRIRSAPAEIEFPDLGLAIQEPDAARPSAPPSLLEGCP